MKPPLFWNVQVPLKRRKLVGAALAAVPKSEAGIDLEDIAVVQVAGLQFGRLAVFFQAFDLPFFKLSAGKRHDLRAVLRIVVVREACAVVLGAGNQAGQGQRERRGQQQRAGNNAGGAAPRLKRFQNSH